MIWKNTDPRLSFDKRGYIVIARPNPEEENGTVFSGGHVETKNGWSILMNFRDKKLIDADTDWDFAWWWIEGPPK